MEFLLATIERRRLLLRIRFGVAELQAAIFELVSKFPLRVLSKPLLTRDQVELLRYDNVVSDTARRDGLTLEGLGITPQSVAAIVPTYLWRFRKAGQFRRHLALADQAQCKHVGWAKARGPPRPATPAALSAPLSTPADPGLNALGKS